MVDKETLARAKYIGSAGWEREKDIVTWPLAFMKSLVTHIHINKVYLSESGVCVKIDRGFRVTFAPGRFL